MCIMAFAIGGLSMNKIIKTEDIASFMKENKLSKKQFCLNCKISANVLNKILNNQTNFYIKALFRIAREMKVKVCSLFI